MKLYPYQQSAAIQILDYAIAHPRGRLLLVMPPRSGKTPTVARIARETVVGRGMRGLWVVGRVEVLDATVDHLVACGFRADEIGVVYRDRVVREGALFYVASEATLDRRTKPEVDFVVWDEAHHDAAPRRRRIRGMYRDAFHLGITGTPERLTGAGLDRDYDDMLVPVQSSELIHDGYLEVPVVYAPYVGDLPSTRGIRRLHGDWSPVDLERVFGRAPIVRNVVDEWERLAEGRQTIVFPCTINHSKKLVVEFRRRGVNAVHLDGDTMDSVRRLIVEKIHGGEVDVVCTVGVLSEGFDAPSVKCVVSARPTRSLSLHVQQSARCMTPWKAAHLKPRILDVVGNCYRLDLPWIDREWSLGRGVPSLDGPPVRRCPACGALSSISRPSCAACGVDFPERASAEPAPASPVELHELTFDRAAVVKKREELEALAAAKQFRPGWVDKVLLTMFGESARDVLAEAGARHPGTCPTPVASP